MSWLLREEPAEHSKKAPQKEELRMRADLRCSTSWWKVRLERNNGVDCQGLEQKPNVSLGFLNRGLTSMQVSMVLS